MAERRRNRKRQEAVQEVQNVDEPDKFEYTVARYLRSHLPQKQTNFLGHKVDYFIASRAIDLIMASPFAQTDKRTDEVKFLTRESVVEFMNIMLQHKFFHRVKTRIVMKEVKKKIDNDSTDEFKSDTKKSKAGPKSGTDKLAVTKKEKKKVKFDMHMDQVFVDGNEPYVWIYDYISPKTWLIGSALVLAAIAICLFPLWPRTVRNYVYYLSIAAASFLFFIIALAVLKLVVYAVVFALTLGRHHLWILPNLTEDVGFLESFWPLFKHEYKPKVSTQVEQVTEQEDQNKETKEVANNETAENVDTDRGDSEAESVSTTESMPLSTNGFEILDSKECTPSAVIK